MSEKKIFYYLTGTFLRNVADETNPVVIDEVFENDNPTVEGRTIYLNKKLIYYIDKQMKVKYKHDIFSNLVYEYGLYRQNVWDCKNHIAICRKVQYLKTPIDFNKSRK